jgi:hypothetical protein
MKATAARNVFFMAFLLGSAVLFRPDAMAQINARAEMTVLLMTASAAEA